MVRLGIANSRMKDFCDIWILCSISDFQGKTVAESIKATFNRRQTKLPEDIPIAFSAEFVKNKAKQAQWAAFINRSRLRITPEPLYKTVNAIQGFLMPPTQSLRDGLTFIDEWIAGGPWKSK